MDESSLKNFLEIFKYSSNNFTRLFVCIEKKTSLLGSRYFLNKDYFNDFYIEKIHGAQKIEGFSQIDSNNYEDIFLFLLKYYVGLMQSSYINILAIKCKVDISKINLDNSDIANFANSSKKEEQIFFNNLKLLRELDLIFSDQNFKKLLKNLYLLNERTKKLTMKFKTDRKNNFFTNLFLGTSIVLALSLGISFGYLVWNQFHYLDNLYLKENRSSIYLTDAEKANLFEKYDLLSSQDFVLRMFIDNNVLNINNLEVIVKFVKNLNYESLIESRFDLEKIVESGIVTSENCLDFLIYLKKEGNLKVNSLVLSLIKRQNLTFDEFKLFYPYLINLKIDYLEKSFAEVFFQKRKLPISSFSAILQIFKQLPRFRQYDFPKMMEKLDLDLIELKKFIQQIKLFDDEQFYLFKVLIDAKILTSVNYKQKIEEIKLNKLNSNQIGILDILKDLEVLSSSNYLDLYNYVLKLHIPVMVSGDFYMLYSKKLLTKSNWQKALEILIKHTRILSHENDLGEIVNLETWVFNIGDFENDLVSIFSRFDFVGCFDSHIIYVVNELHNDATVRIDGKLYSNENNEVRSFPLKSLNVNQLFYLLSKRGELHTSSYKNILIPIFFSKLDELNLTFSQALNKKILDEKYLLSVLNGIGDVNELVKVLPSSEHVSDLNKFYKFILDDFIKATDDVDGVLGLAPLVEILVKDNSIDDTHRRLFFDLAIKYYQKLKPIKKDILALILATNLEYLENIEIGRSILLEIKSVKQRYDSVNARSSKVWFETDFYKNTKEVWVKQYFYSDSDGVYSFESFLKYSKNNNYSLFVLDGDNKEVSLDLNRIDFATFHKTEQKVLCKKKLGDSILIYELEFYDQATHILSLESALRGEKYVSLIHRGHSYHLSKTFPSSKTYKLPFVKLLGLGSCGGYNSLGVILKSIEKRNAVFFATQGTGTLVINNPLILTIFENIVKSNGDISWDELGQILSKIYSSDSRGKDYFDPSSMVMKILPFLNQDNS